MLPLATTRLPSRTSASLRVSLTVHRHRALGTALLVMGIWQLAQPLILGLELQRRILSHLQQQQVQLTWLQRCHRCHSQLGSCPHRVMCT